MSTIRLLGAGAVAERSQDSSGRPASPRRVALLALLAVARAAGAKRDVVLALLWQGQGGDLAAQQLAELVASFRGEFGAQAIAERDGSLQLDSTRVAVDVSQFETAADAGDLARAAAVYAGEFLEGFFLDDAVEFEQWASDQRTRLARRAAAVLDELADTARQRGDQQLLIDLLRRRVEIEPYAAGPTLALMRTLESAGDAHAALRAGRTYESRIRTYLEADPAPEVLAETRRLRAIVGPLATPAGGTANTPDKR